MIWASLALAGPLYLPAEVPTGTRWDADLAWDAVRSRDVRLQLRLDGTERSVGSLSKRKFRRLPAEVFAAVQLAVSTVGGPKEMDVLVDGRAVTLWIDGPTRWTFALGQPLPPLRPRPLDEVLAAGGFVGVEQVDRELTPAVVDALHRALEVLTPEEKVATQGLKLVRTETNPVRPEFVAAYRNGRKTADLAVYDGIDDLGERFVGAVDKPYSPQVHALLHELGHAVANTGFRRDRATFLAQRAAYFADLEALDPAVADDATLLAMDQRAEHLTELDLQLTRELVFAEYEGGPVVQRFAEAFPGVAPTPYARVSIVESFAECFALQHLDPDALDRAAPGVREWFERGQHLESVDDVEQPPSP